MQENSFKNSSCFLYNALHIDTDSKPGNYLDRKCICSLYPFLGTWLIQVSGQVTLLLSLPCSCWSSSFSKPVLLFCLFFSSGYSSQLAIFCITYTAGSISWPSILPQYLQMQAHLRNRSAAGTSQFILSSSKDG